MRRSFVLCLLALHTMGISVGNAGPKNQDEQRRSFRFRCGMGFAYVAGVAGLGLLAYAMTSDDPGGPPGEEPPFLPDTNRILPEDTIFRSLDPNPASDFDPSFVTDRSKLQMVDWDEFPDKSTDLSQASVPGVFTKAVEDYKKFAYRGEEGVLIERLSKSVRDPAKLSKMSAKQLLELAAKLVQKQISFELVDDKYPSNKLSFYWDLGKGDCDKYRDLTAALFYDLKKRAGNTEAFFVVNESFGSNSEIPGLFYQRTEGRHIGHHAWTSVVAIDDDGKWKVSHLDPTWGRHTFSSLDANNAKHVDKAMWRYYFFDAAGSPQSLIREFRHEDIGKEKDEWRYTQKSGMTLRALIRGWEYDRVSELARYYETRASADEKKWFKNASQDYVIPEALMLYTQYVRTEAPFAEAVKRGDWNAIQNRVEEEVRALGFVSPATNNFLAKLKHPKGDQLIKHGHTYGNKLRQEEFQRRYGR